MIPLWSLVLERWVKWSVLALLHLSVRGGRHWLVLVGHRGRSVLLVVSLLVVKLGVDVGKRRLVLAILHLRSSKLLRVAVGLHRVWVESLLEHLRTLHAIVTHVDLSRHVVLVLGLLVARDVEALL